MSIDPALIRAEAHVEIGTLLQRDVGILIDRWARRAAEEQPQARRVHHQVLLDHLPDFLRVLGQSLAESKAPESMQHFLPAATHGEHRWQTGWSLAEVVRDFQLLRLVIFDYLEEILQRAVSQRETLALGLALDDAIAASVAMYVKHRDEHTRQVEEERAQGDRRVQEQLKRQAEILRTVDRRKSEFLATLGHELRNPLAALWNAVQVLDKQPSFDVTLVQTRDIIKRRVQLLERLVDDLLDISRIAQDKIALRLAPVDLSDLLAQAAQISAPHLRGRHQQFEVSLPDEPVWLEADSARIVQIIVNLLNNAAKYTKPGGHVWLEARRANDQAVVTVRDTGMGIPADVLPHVFDLFTQADLSPEHTQGGMGIGLALVRRLVELHGGSIAARSPGAGQGSEFVVNVPALPAPPVQAAGRALPAGLPAVMPARRRILIVDDNVDAAVTFGMLLTEDGHEVHLAHDGPSALDKAGALHPEVILLDIGMPRMDGYEVARRLREQPGMDNIFLVALTGYGQEEDRRRSKESGFDAHLVKPVDLKALQTLLAPPGQAAGVANAERSMSNPATQAGISA